MVSEGRQLVISKGVLVGSWVAKLGEGWLSWETGGLVGRWVAKLGDGVQAGR